MSIYERVGWTLFMISGVFFVILGIREGDALTIAGAATWMLGCASFLLGWRR